MVVREGVRMPAPECPEFRRQAVELARLRESRSLIAKDPGVAESGLRRWMAKADIDEGSARA